MSTPPKATFCRDETPHLLVVEGKDDCHGIYQIAARSGLEKSFGIWEGGNDDGALERFGGLLLSSRNRPRILGIVLDSDTDEEGGIDGTARRWAQLQGRLADMQYMVPAAPDPGGTIIEGPEGYPRVGIWLMPDNRSDGMFEDFLLYLVPAPARTFAAETTRAAKERGYGGYKDAHESKAIAHTYLAWQDEPGRPLGIAIKAGLFDLDRPTAGSFINWLRQLFEPPPAAVRG